jgi:uroporphyrinogen III methyltransferase/synthase
VTGTGATLAGVGVIVTRPGGEDDGLAGALRGAGARVIAFPVVEIAEPEDGGAALARAAADLGRYRWVAFTSANAVRRLLASVPDGASFGRTRLAAVGPATAAALVEHELVADLVATRTSAEGLAGEFPEPAVPGEAVLFPASAGARRTLPEALRAKGWTVDEVVAYRTVPVAAPPGSVVAELASASAVTFASPSAVGAYVGLRADDGSALPVPPVVACIGPVTASAARDAGLEGVVAAPEATPDALVRVLAGALAVGPPGEGAGGSPGEGAGGPPGDRRGRPR